MSHIIATVQDQTYHINTHEEDPYGKITLNEQLHAIDWKRIAPLAMDAKGHVDTGGRYSLLLAGRSYEVFARRITRANEKDNQSYEIFIGGQRFEVKTQDEHVRLLSGLLKEKVHSDEEIIHAPMPGLVAGVLLEVGAEVKVGQPVIVLEAMKMENDLSAPISGKIKAIHVNKGQTVDLGDALVVIDGSVGT